MVAAAVRFMIANEGQMMPSETDELHEPLFMNCRNFLQGSFLLEGFRQKSKINIQNPNMEVFLEFFNRQN